MSPSKKPKNYRKVLLSLDYDFPGLLKIPRSPGTWLHRDMVDIHLAKRKLELVDRLPKFDSAHVKSNNFDLKEFRIDNVFLATLMAAGFNSVFEELMLLLQEEKSLLEHCNVDGGRLTSFSENKELMKVLINGMIECAKAETSDNYKQKLRIRKALGERLIIHGDFWLARKMFKKCLSYLETIDEETDKARCELWCLIAYVCIYFEDNQDVGYDLPTKCLMLAQQISEDKPWFMSKSVMDIFIPKITNVYGLRNDWIKVKADWINMYSVVTTLLHVLSVKKAKYWQNELRRRNIKESNPTEYQHLCAKVSDELTYALAYADDVRQNSAFLATVLRRGLFYEEIGQKEKALEDYGALHALAKQFDDKEALAMALNRFGYYENMMGNTVPALDCFVGQLDISREHEFAEIQGDAMADLGTLLLEEGHTWEAEECYAQAYDIFRNTLTSDTPNNQDDVSWGMLGVCRGQHLWGRFATHLRTKQRQSVRSILEWKSFRKPLPPVVIPSPNYRAHRRSEYERHYGQGNENDTRRLFEFNEGELHGRTSTWYVDSGFLNIFDYINQSDKPRDNPEFDDEEGGGNREMKLAFLTEMRRIKAEYQHARWAKYRSVNSVVNKEQDPDFSDLNRIRKKKIRALKLARFERAKDPTLTIEERMAALLEDLQDVTKVRASIDDDYDDEPEDSEIVRMKTSDVHSRLLLRFQGLVDDVLPKATPNVSFIEPEPEGEEGEKENKKKEEGNDNDDDEAAD